MRRTPYEDRSRKTLSNGCSAKDQHQIEYELGLIEKTIRALLPDGP